MRICMLSSTTRRCNRVRCPYADTPGERMWVKETCGGEVRRWPLAIYAACIWLRNDGGLW